MGRLMSRYQIFLRLISSLLFLIALMSCPCSSSHTPSSAPSCLPEDSSALLHSINSLTLEHDDDLRSSWNESTSCCLWEGVTCDQMSGRVIGLDLSYRYLSGSIPKNSSLFRLHGLRRLNLTGNSFWDSTLAGFNQLVNLTYLDLSNSNFSGLVPSDISHLSKLISLDLSGNDLLTIDGHNFDMLARNLTKLRNLLLDYVNMVDVAPASLLNLSSSLKLLSIRDCSLTGEFPSQIFHFPHLDTIHFSWNRNATGYLPLSNWSRALKVLDLSSCGFRESIPSSLGNLTQLTFIDMSGNKFEGEIPSTLFNLTQLTSLDLSGNRLDGILPSHVSRLQNLNEVHLSENLLRGKVPSWLFSLPSLTHLDLSKNRFIGPIDEIQKLNSLEVVYLDHNYIDGPIPTFFFDLVNIEQLDLSSNSFSGVIKPRMLSKAKHLETIDISNNSFISLSSNGSDLLNNTFPALVYLYASYCDLRQFPNFLRTAYSLTHLDLSHNKIYGSVSNYDAEGWESLEILSLSYNSLTSFGQFQGKNLGILDLSWNLINSQFPVLSPSLRAFSISGNIVTGKIHPSVCNLTLLELLDISENSLDGIIPTCLANGANLQIVNLRLNNLQGNIPSFCTVYDSLGLDILALNDNQLEGLVPRSLMNCSSLKILNLANNKLRDTFPHWLGVVSKLRILSLRGNKLHGPFPNSIEASSFPNLQIIDLSQNEFNGLLPAKFFQLLKAMNHIAKNTQFRIYKYEALNYLYEYDAQFSVNITTKRMEMDLLGTLDLFVGMDLSNNLFEGHIPEEVGELCSLRLLNLSHNSLTGPIPPSLGNVLALESLDLSSNMLNGKIPTQLTSLTFLEVFNLSYNRLEGPIPSGKQFNTFGNDSYIGNSGLCGLPLSKQCDKGPNPHAAKVKKEDSIAFTWKVAMMGYGCGMVLGVSMGYIVFTNERPWWFVSLTERHLQGKVTRWINKIRGRRN